MSPVGGSLLKYLIRNRENLITSDSNYEDEVAIQYTAYNDCHINAVGQSNTFPVTINMSTNWKGNAIHC